MIALRICKKCGREFDAIVGINQSIYCDDCLERIQFESDMSEGDDALPFTGPCEAATTGTSDAAKQPAPTILKLQPMVGQDPYAKLKTQRAKPKKPCEAQPNDVGFEQVDANVLDSVANIDLSAFV